MVEVTFWPEGKSVRVRPGTTLLDAARLAGRPLTVRCGGKAACLMCKIGVHPEHGEAGLSRPTPQERRKLGEGGGSRLGCQCRALGDCQVVLPENPLKAAVRRQLERQAEEDDDSWLRSFRRKDQEGME
ncbi:2Fe-2S iron-sulfur cluster binding domain-containing protein [Paenibacillus albicereus]|uniref:2Fe-2S iron-sulfur cluster binding domain-containing protein n=1 Tax=Paenibacillus albicereus TaxID=2726185 RepID=A0A6H2GWS6_9BACL|nr:2Fe-2S iron-sulfur cluster-binding protein [Paenibacillus albicereus]QJC51855.1 2Fe-2S iron-sulfur cluster binding domain-containing protein [Paenibacillus albicereus]